MQRWFGWAALAVMLGCGGAQDKVEAPDKRAAASEETSVEAPVEGVTADDGIRPGSFPCGVCRSTVHVNEGQRAGPGTMEVFIGDKAAARLRARGIERLELAVKSAEGVVKSIELGPDVLAKGEGIKIFDESLGLAAGSDPTKATLTLVAHWSEKGKPMRSSAPIPITVSEVK